MRNKVLRRMRGKTIVIQKVDGSHVRGVLRDFDAATVELGMVSHLVGESTGGVWEATAPGVTLIDRIKVLEYQHILPIDVVA